ncbi:hypothetical protein nbrc107696_23920 [Gordonia spumicola]|uniref:Uncharacterized protein n=1 Tax=Gordonia spumicola TaxID=589161 RepID=A0A7I9V964_9ACTN|nr:hypothetical protein [Gordonia spumicola]GEE01946.1 hypothetical protein nbrc107696_23920 [Gordonia spumicola]
MTPWLTISGILISIGLIILIVKYRVIIGKSLLVLYVVGWIAAIFWAGWASYHSSPDASWIERTGWSILGTVGAVVAALVVTVFLWTVAEEASNSV